MPDLPDLPEDIEVPEDIAEFNIVQSQANYEKKPIEQIVKEAAELDVEKMAVEVLSWAITNVEQYVDNSTREYQLNLVLDSEDEAEEELDMSEVRKLQSLYRAIPDDSACLTPQQMHELLEGKLDITDFTEDTQLDQIISCKEILDNITAQVHATIRNLDEYMLTLYKRLVYYYEMVAIKDGKPVERELEGLVDVTKFEYDAFPVAVRVRSPIIENISEDQSKEEVTTNKGTMIREYMIPEGFILFIELAFRDVHKSASLF